MCLKLLQFVGLKTLLLIGISVSLIIGLDVEMEIGEQSCEVVGLLLRVFKSFTSECSAFVYVDDELCLFIQIMDIVDELFVTMFDTLNANCKMELEVIRNQYPFEPLKVVNHCKFVLL